MMGYIKNRFVRVGLWSIFVSVIGTYGMVQLDIRKQKHPLQGEIPEIKEMSKGIKKIPRKNTLPYNPKPYLPPVEVGTDFASKKTKEVKILIESEKPDYEKMLSFLTKSHAKQLAAFKENRRDTHDLRFQLEEQGKQIEMILSMLYEQEEKVASLDGRATDLNNRFTAEESLKANNMAKVVKLYSTMPTENVSKIIEDLEDEPLAAIFSNMKEKDMAKIMAIMPPERAATLTLKLADFSKEEK